MDRLRGSEREIDGCPMLCVPRAPREGVARPQNEPARPVVEPRHRPRRVCVSQWHGRQMLQRVQGTQAAHRR